VTKQRLDLLLVELGLAPSREKARAMIMAGAVLADDRPIDKAGTLVPTDADVRIKGQPLPFVSRGGLKLRHALDEFKINVEGLTALDVGISTGGFTDCLLQRGAAKVFGIDVGVAQVDWKIRTDPRVVLFEGANVRHFDPAKLGEPVDLAVVDVSFISLVLVLPVVVRAVKPGGLLLPMVKPQFEVGKGEVGKRGVVRDEAKRLAAVEKIARFSASDLGLEVAGRTPSPLPGPEGNVEYFLLLRNGSAQASNPARQEG
jgi:23S rRNA (cytidine1920-2'-O)/16S rRNA (cytidine1409-2'-O)-methyltransferase